MVICPIAIAVGCRKCAIFRICPVKGLIGDYKPDEKVKNPPRQGKAKASAAKRRAQRLRNVRRPTDANSPRA